ncbi:MarR family transcriptional regulator [Brucepastera parasyntrophica]|uniref:MarR family winged helix-turn-helix transcriptional regulator n=1 Tax=Brucepastera parasyntrophica TaxID=2880008 RepID=UPI0021097F73|nr:MarR family transcriptional regulator [Brucepastera parasyntrophica]ULQ59133.1 MarR family transcriptional regulator [Brucepastera parasyntrophica]
MNQRDIGALLKLITDKMRAGGDAELKEKDLTFSQSTVLNYLYDRSEEVTQKEIEVFLGVSHPAVAGIVSRLETKDFVYSYPDPNDKRNKMVGLTAKAKKITGEIQKGIRFGESALTYCLSAEETEELRRMLVTVYENFDKYTG